MKNLHMLAMMSLVFALLVSPSALAMGPQKQTTIVDVALAVNGEGSPYEGQFDILIAALVAEETVLERLSKRGQYTVFAPTDAAFEALFAELGVTPQAVLADKQLLNKVLRYHVARGVRDAETVLDARQIRTDVYGFLKVDAENVQLIDENMRTANIIVTDVFADNGVIHVIDRVVLPR